MRKYLLLMLSVFLASCTTTPEPPPPTAPPASRSVLTIIDGPATAAALNTRYQDTRQNCGSASTPAFLCSGVIVRVTTYSPDYDSWDPSDTAIAKKGVSFSYLRKDSKFSRMPWGGENGFLLYPIFSAPPDKMDPDVLCNYPIDGHTDDRDEKCGSFAINPTSRPCELQGITTAAQWLSLYQQQAGSNRHLCAFNVRDDTNHLAGPAFYASLVAKSQGAPTDQRFTQHNELVLGVWAKGLARTLPIQAFFYTTAAGLASAKKDRANFLQQTQVTLPLIKITLPTSQAQEASFQYIESDNAESGFEFDTSTASLAGRTYILPGYPNVLPTYNSGNALTRQASGGQPPYAYTSANSAIAAVDNNGWVTARGNGSTQITATDSTGQSKSFTVNVSNVVQAHGFGNSTWNQASSTVAASGARLPSMAELAELEVSYGSRWPMGLHHYWSTESCGLNQRRSRYIHNGGHYCYRQTGQYANVVGFK